MCVIFSFARIICLYGARTRKQTQSFSSRALTYSATATATATSDDDDGQFNSSKAVNFLYNLRNEPGVALSYFHHLTNKGFKHDVSTYAALVKTLCIGDRRRDLISVLWNIIARNTVEISHLLNALTEEQTTPSIKMAHDELVKLYVNVGKFDEAIQVLFVFSSKGFLPHIKTFNFLSNSLINHGKVDMFLALYKQLENLGCKPDIFTYTIFVKVLSKKGRFSVDDGCSVLEEMYQAGVGHDAIFCSMFIEGLCANQGSYAGYHSLQEWRKNLFIPICAYTAIFRGFCHEMNFDMAEKVMLDMENQGLHPDAYCYGALVNGYCKAGDNDKAFMLFGKMLVLNMEPSKMMYIKLISTFCRDGDIKRARHVFDDLRRRGTPDVIAYTRMIHGYCKKNFLEEAEKLFREMKTRDVKPNIVIYTVLLDSHSKTIQSRGCSLTGASGNEEETSYDAIFSLYDKIVDRGLEPDMKSYTVLIDMFVRWTIFIKLMAYLKLWLIED